MLLTPIFTITYLMHKFGNSKLFNDFSSPEQHKTVPSQHLTRSFNRLQHSKLNSFLLATRYIQGCVVWKRRGARGD